MSQHKEKIPSKVLLHLPPTLDSWRRVSWWFPSLHVVYREVNVVIFWLVGHCRHRRCSRAMLNPNITCHKTREYAGEVCAEYKARKCSQSTRGMSPAKRWGKESVTQAGLDPDKPEQRLCGVVALACKCKRTTLGERAVETVGHQCCHNTI